MIINLSQRRTTNSAHYILKVGTECDKDPTMRENNVYRQKPHKYFLFPFDYKQ